jgi:hypothetical protein|tara:strand:+ start:5138 stop:5416 length:279 start_codon:yes stop_codon:yes gene_type:complete
MKETLAYDKNRNPLKQTKYQSKEWPFKTKKSATKAFAEFEKIYGRGWYYYEGWNPATYKELPWITRFHPDYKLYLAYNRRKKRERQVRRDSK